MPLDCSQKTEVNFSPKSEGASRATPTISPLPFKVARANSLTPIDILTKGQNACRFPRKYLHMDVF